MNPWLRNLLCGGGGGGGGGAVLPPAGRTMLANLTSSLILDEGTGGPTWSRATKAWGFNELGYLGELASGCAFFGGARLVRNRVVSSENFLSGWTKNNGTETINSANNITFASSSDGLIVTGMGAGAMPLNAQVIMSARMWTDSGTYSVRFRIGGTYSSAISVTTTPTNYYAVVTCGASSTYGIFASGSGGTINATNLQIVDVTNYNASYIPEYVSVGVEASPYFGAGIDGAKYFETDWQGAPIAAANLLRVRREASATNNLLGSRDFFINWTPGVVAGTLFLDDFSSYADTAAMTAAGWAAAASTTQALSSAAVLITNAGAVFGSSSKALTTEVGKTYLTTFAFTKTTANVTAYVANTAVAASAERLNTVSGTVTGGYSFIFTATATTTYLVFGLNSSTVGHEIKIDDVLVKESKVTVTKATGLDGIANTATTLTATAADAIILQPISLASAARCASAYVKRKTGTGTISFTQDGTNWTDITAQINSSTWSRVQITSTLANPSVGFKIGTSGDAIDVDCVQNEAGAVATSPIVTTTSTVSRNGDSLTYQTTGNIDFAVGTVYCETQFTTAISTRRAVSIGADGHCYINTGDANTIWKAYDGTNIVTKSGLSDISTAKRKRVVSWGTGLKVTGDGISPASGSFDGSFGSGASIEIGQFINGYVGPVAIYNYQMTDAELQAITA